MNENIYFVPFCRPLAYQGHLSWVTISLDKGHQLGIRVCSPKMGYFIVYQVCSGQGLVVRNEGAVIKDTGCPKNVPLYFSTAHLGNSLYSKWQMCNYMDITHYGQEVHHLDFNTSQSHIVLVFREKPYFSTINK